MGTKKYVKSLKGFSVKKQYDIDLVSGKQAVSKRVFKHLTRLKYGVLFAMILIRNGRQNYVINVLEIFLIN